jgi:hypothetical protein
MNRLSARRNRHHYLPESFPALRVGDRVAFTADSEWELGGRVIAVDGEGPDARVTVESVDNSRVPADLRVLGWHAIGSHRTVEWGGGLRAVLLEDGRRLEPVTRQPVNARQGPRA